MLAHTLSRPSSLSDPSGMITCGQIAGLTGLAVAFALVPAMAGLSTGAVFATVGSTGVGGHGAQGVICNRSYFSARPTINLTNGSYYSSPLGRLYY